MAKYENSRIKHNKFIPRKPWIRNAIMISCNKKEKLYKIWKKIHIIYN